MPSAKTQTGRWRDALMVAFGDAPASRVRNAVVVDTPRFTLVARIADDGGVAVDLDGRPDEGQLYAICRANTLLKGELVGRIRVIRPDWLEDLERILVKYHPERRRFTGHRYEQERLPTHVIEVGGKKA